MPLPARGAASQASCMAPCRGERTHVIRMLPNKLNIDPSQDVLEVIIAQRPFQAMRVCPRALVLAASPQWQTLCHVSFNTCQ